MRSRSRARSLAEHRGGIGGAAEDIRVRDGETGKTDDDIRLPPWQHPAAAELVTAAPDHGKFNAG